MRVLVCGGRDFQDHEAVTLTLLSFSEDVSPITHLITGAAPGADSLAASWALASKTSFTEYPADWKTHGKAAGPIRNQRMLDEGKPDLVIAFPGGRGTADMVRRAEKAGVPVRKVGW